MSQTRSWIAIGAAVAALLMTTGNAAGQSTPDSINAVIGDASWVAAHGRLPDDTAGEIARITTHLRYVLAVLRRRDVSRLSPAQQSRRRAALHALERYIARGLFPRRTADGYPGRRPRFIDDGGVHCAVGQLIADSGAPELARSINGRFEYAYVGQMLRAGAFAHEAPGASPGRVSLALAAWAARTGFTVRELAMIQPRYHSWPTERSSRRGIERAAEGITVACAKKHPHIDELRLRVRSDSSGLEVSATDTRPFARCFARMAARAARGGGAMRGSRKDFRFQMPIRIQKPQAIFEKWARSVHLSNAACVPRPGAIPERASVDMSAGSTGLVVAVQTWPANREVSACFEAHVRSRMIGFDGPGAWRLKTALRTRILPLVNSASLLNVLRRIAPAQARLCHPDGSPPANVVVSVAARRDARQFDIAVKARDRALVACLRAKLDTGLRDNFTVYRQGKRYFRIDGDAKASHRFASEAARRR